jgi:hypothetical protein
MPLPNLLIIGAAKSGTSSLYSYLGQHPDIFMSGVKEPAFFIWEGKTFDVNGPSAYRIQRRIFTDLRTYQTLFEAATSERIIGEASTGYLHTPDAPQRIFKHVPNAKLMAVLRNPIDRAYSAFLHARRQGFEPIPDFRTALHAEKERITARWTPLTHYVSVGMYAEQLQRYLQVFENGQIRVYLHDDLARDPGAVLRDAFDFLGVDETFKPDIDTKFNLGRAVRSPRLDSLMNSKELRRLGKGFLPGGTGRVLARSLRRVNQLRDRSLSASIRQELAAVFETDLVTLSAMLRRDLSPWLEGLPVPSPEESSSVGIFPTVARK